MKRFFLVFVAVGLVGVGFFFKSSLFPRPFLKKYRLVSFEESMSRKGSSPKLVKKKLRKDRKWKKIKALYDRHITHGELSKNPRIPKIIHQIWLGSPLPEKYKKIQATWKACHPDWEYRLWTDADVKTFHLKNQALYDSAVNWGEKSDIFRYEILFRHGGLYVDTDFECLRSFEALHHLCDFYIGLETIESKAQFVRMPNGLIGAAPGHPILKQCIETMSGAGSRDDCDLIQARTGPGLIRRCFFKEANDPSFKNVALPFSYFYPLPGTKRDGSMGGPIKNGWIQEESFAIHYWDSSWVPQK